MASKKRKGKEAKVEIEPIVASNVEFPWRVWKTKEGPWIGVNDVLRLTAQEDDRDDLISTMEFIQNEFLESMWEPWESL